MVAEYHYHDRNDFVIDVELFSLDELEQQVAELLDSYRHFHLHADRMTDENERENAEEAANLARDTFLAMFRGRLESEQFLRRGSTSAVLSTLQSWVEELRPSAIAGRTTEADCTDLLSRLTSEQMASREPAVWPFIRVIKSVKFISASKSITNTSQSLLERIYPEQRPCARRSPWYVPSLREYLWMLILTNICSGLRDLNAARRAITERYLLKCDEIFAVCNIGRAITDVGVSSVIDLAKQAGLSNVGIICTRSDVRGHFQAVSDMEQPRLT